MKTHRSFLLSLLVVSVLSLFAPQARADESEPSRVAAAPEQWERRSTALVVGGVASITMGVPTTLVGGLATAMCVGPWGGNFDPRVQSPQSHCYPTVGITSAGLGLVAAGVFGIVYGSQRVPVGETTSLVPSIAIGPRSGSLTWRF
jgi:hypothetical protein